MTEQHEGCLAVGQLAQSLKERFRLHRTLLGVLVAKAGAAEGRAKQNELPGMVDAQARGEKAAVQVRVGTPERGELTLAHVHMLLLSSHVVTNALSSLYTYTLHIPFLFDCIPYCILSN